MRTKIYNWILTNELLILICCGVILIRIPSWFEPYWYGDEAIYLTIGQAINRGAALYGQIHDNKPPLLYLMAAFSRGDLFWFKILATASVVLTVITFVGLARNVLGSKPAALIATLIFAASLCWPKLEGNIANAELFFLLPTVAAVRILTGKDLGVKRILTAGCLIGVAGLFKVPAVLEVVIWPLIWLFTGNRKWLKNSLILGFGVLIPIVISGLYYQWTNTLADYLQAAWIQNIPYLSSWKQGDAATGVFSLKNRLGILTAILALIFGLNRRWGKNGTIVSAWLGVSMFGALLSARPYPHYLLQALPAAVLAITLVMFDKPMGKLIQTILLAVSGSAIVVFGFYNYSVVNYYSNFLDWASGNKSGEKYLEWFGPQNKTNYEIANKVKEMTMSDDQIFVWGDEPMVYALTKRSPVGKYTVKYHIKDFEAEAETLQILTERPPALVVSYGKENELPGFKTWLEKNYQPEQVIGNAVIFIREASN